MLIAVARLQHLECLCVRIEMNNVVCDISNLPGIQTTPVAEVLLKRLSGLPVVDETIEQLISGRVQQYMPTLIQEVRRVAVHNARS